MRALGRTVAREVSVWFGEGIAEFYSTIQLRGRQTWVGEPVAPHIQMLGNRNMLDLKTLWAARYGSPEYREKSKPGLFYAQSVVLVHMLHLPENYRAGVASFVSRTLQGEPDAPRSAFGRTPISKRICTNTFRTNRYRE